jgi:hypothetical protein
MARFAGMVGFAAMVDRGNGIHEEVITERKFYGDEVRPARGSQDNPETVNPDITTNTSISIVASAKVRSQFRSIRYIKWMGSLWEISEVAIEAPRLLLRLGGLYNGPTPETSDAP